MPKRTFPFDRGGMDRIIVSWKAFWKDVTVEFDGSRIGTIPGQKELQEGKTFELNDGSVLEIKLVRTWSSTSLQVLRDGKPLPGSGSDPNAKLKQSYGILYLIGGLNLVLGLIALLFQVDLLLEIGMGIYTVIVGSVYLLLAFLVQRKSKIALGIAIGLYGIETILALISGVVSGVVVRVFVIAYIWPGFQAINQLREDDLAG
jgi:hypothetical protein